MGLEKADWRFDWLHSDHSGTETVLNRYDDILSTTLWVKTGYWNFVTEAFYATGERCLRILHPTDVRHRAEEAATRRPLYVFDGRWPDSVFAQTRYERSVPGIAGGGRAKEYHAGYLGLQYFIYGDKLKLLAGAEYAHLDGGGNGGDFDGLTVLTGVGLSF